MENKLKEAKFSCRRRGLMKVGLWSAPVVTTINLPAHAQTSETEQSSCASDFTLVPNAIVYREGDTVWADINPETIQAGFVAVNVGAEVSNVPMGATIFWEVAIDGPGSLTDIENFGVTNGTTLMSQENTDSTNGIRLPDPDDFNPGTSGYIIFKATVTPMGCSAVSKAILIDLEMSGNLLLNDAAADERIQGFVTELDEDLVAVGTVTEYLNVTP